MTDTLGSRVTWTKNVAIRSRSCSNLRMETLLRIVGLEVMTMPLSKNYSEVPSLGSTPLFFTLSIFLNVLFL